MIRYVSLLRGINVGGRRKVSMAQLREIYASLGFRGIQTYVQSGNVIFTDGAIDLVKMQLKIEKQISRAFGFDILVFLRTKNELQAIIHDSPFKKKDEGKLHVTFLSEKPSNVPVTELDGARAGSEEYSISGREVYLFCPNGYGSTKLSNNFLEKKLGVRATTRNWKTVNTLLAMVSREV
jgi:uncharacterized protein (DUF1697 family)